MTNSIQVKVLARMRRDTRRIYTSKDFLDLGARAAVDQALTRLADSKTIQRIGRGLYRIPRVNPRLGIELAPDMDEIAQALARRTGSRVVPSGAVAANSLGLSTQVPAKPVYLTDGRTRSVRVGHTIFILKHAAPKDLPLGRPTSAMVFQALRQMGREAVGQDMIAHLRRRLSPQERRRLLKDAPYVTDWVAEAIRQICAGNDRSKSIRHG
ncbi:MAG: DUF6088 family protein [Elusimicrobia bacterium]|nr:DUF6088 family protein [Candidatus Obscuribacterium magneticum]